MECVNLVLQSIFIEPVTEYLQVIWMQYAGVFLQLLVVGINLELSGFVTDDRLGRVLFKIPPFSASTKANELRTCVV